MVKGPWIAVAVVIGLGALGLAGCVLPENQSSPPPPEQSQEEKETEVKVDKLYRASLAINLACMAYQLNAIERSQVMDYAQRQYEKEYGNAAEVNWRSAIELAVNNDKKLGLECIE